MTEYPVAFRNYVEALFAEKDRALSMAADEREKAADVLRQEQHRALQTAEAEREKAAQALRNTLAAQIREGDERLREHISNQIQQVRDQYKQVQAALESADKLELSRLANLERQITLQLAARDTAINKADVNSEKRFESVNEFRAQMNDQQQRFLPREVFESQVFEIGKKLDANTKRLDQLSGQQAGTKATLAMMLSFAVVLIATVSFLANYLTSH